MLQKRVAIIGQQCSGKTTITNMLAKKIDESITIKFADPIYDVLTAMHQKKHRAFMQDFGEMCKRHFGERIFTDIFRKNVQNIRLAGAILCDDVRRDYEAATAKDLGFKIIYVHADRSVRKRRALALGLDFIENHISETQVPSLRKYSDAIIFNNYNEFDSLENNLACVFIDLFSKKVSQ